MSPLVPGYAQIAGANKVKHVSGWRNYVQQWCIVQNFGIVDSVRGGHIEKGEGCPFAFEILMRWWHYWLSGII